MSLPGRQDPAGSASDLVIVVADSGPLIAAMNDRDPAHALSAAVVTELGRDLVVPVPVVTEVDQLIRARAGGSPARAFLGALARGRHTVAPVTAELFRRAVAIDSQFADLNLGWVDAAVMAVAERRDAAVFTFDFRDFRVTRSERGPWRLLVDERGYRASAARM